MSSNVKKWDVLSFNYNEEVKSILYMYLENEIIGYEDVGGESKVYFRNISKNNINKIMESQTLIDSWDWKSVKEENWMQSCSKFFQPVIVNNMVHIIAPWHKKDSNYINIKINPALAFGTGHHSTTTLMIKAMLNIDFEDKSVVDIGTGSGILSILAKKLKSKLVHSLDNDSLIVDNFLENFKLNSIDSREPMIVDCMDVDYKEYDVILANINKNIILKLLPSFERKNAIIVLSGILSSDEFDILNSKYIVDYKLFKKYKDKEWICLVLEPK